MLLTKRQQKIVICTKACTKSMSILMRCYYAVKCIGQCRMRLLTVGQLFDLFSFS